MPLSSGGESAFDAAAPTCDTFGFDAGGVISVEPKPVTCGGLSFYRGGTVTLSTGNVFTITPSSMTARFIGFTSTSLITSISVNYPESYTFDLTSFSVSAVRQPANWAMLLAGFGGLGAVTLGSRRQLTAKAA